MTAQSEDQRTNQNPRVKCCPIRSRHHHDVRLHQGVHSVGPAHLDPAPVGLMMDGRCPHIRCAYPGRAGGAPSRPAALGSAAARLAIPKTWPGIISSKPMTWSSASTPTIIVASGSERPHTAESARRFWAYVTHDRPG